MSIQNNAQGCQSGTHLILNQQLINYHIQQQICICTLLHTYAVILNSSTGLFPSLMYSTSILSLAMSFFSFSLSMLCPFSPGAPEHFEFWRGKTSKGAHLSEVFGEGAKRPSEAGVGSRLGVKMSEVKMSEVIMSEVKDVRGKNVRGKNISGKNVRVNNVRGKHV